MAELEFKVRADYSAIREVEKEITALEKKIASFNPALNSPKELNQWRTDLLKLKQTHADLSAQFELVSRAAKKMGVDISSVAKDMRNISLSANDATHSLRELNTSANGTGNIFSQVSGGFANAVKQYGAASLAIGGIYSGISQLKQSIGTIMSFQSANASLQAILNATDEQMQGFKKTAEELGRSTVFTASQVTELQIALSKLGFSESNIHAMEEPVLHFAQATGASLDEAASTTGAALRMFGVAEEEYEEKTVQFTNAMATATMSSALDFRMIRDNLATFGPMAHSMGMGIEDVLALFGKLKDSGVEASTAMTSLRNIFTKVAQGKIEGMGEVHSLDDFVKGLKNMGSLDPGNGMKMIGPRGGTQFITLKEQADSILKLRDDIVEGMNKDTTGGMADKMTANLTGSLKTLESAWEGFILTFQESDGVVKDVVDDLTSVIGGFRELIAGESDWSRETIEGIATAVKAVIASIAAFKSIEFVGGALESAKEKIEDIKDAYDASKIAAQNAELIKSAGLKEADAKAEGTRTQAARAQAVAIQQEIQLERQQAIEQIKATARSNDATLSKLRKAEINIRLTQEAIIANRKEMAQEIENARVAQLTNNVTARKIALKEAEKRAVLEVTLAKKLEAEQGKVAIAQDAVLTKHGQAQLVTQTALAGNIGKTTGAFSKLSAALNAVGLGLLTNPYVLFAAALGACAYASYKLITAQTDLQKSYTSIQDAVTKATKSETENTQNAIASAKSQVTALKTIGSSQGMLAGQSKVYQDTLKSLKGTMDEYGISLQTSKDEEGNEIVTVEELTQKHKELEEAIKNESKTRQEVASISTINEEKAKQRTEANTTFKEALDDAGIEGSEVISTEIISHIREEDIQNLAQYRESLNKLAQLRKEDKVGTEEYRKEQEKLNAASAQIEKTYAVLDGRIEALGRTLGWSEEQTQSAKDGIRKLMDSYGNTEYNANKLIKAIESATRAIDKQATLAKLKLGDLKKYLQDIAKTHKITIVTDYKTEGAVPEWMKKQFTATQKNAELARQNADAYAAIAKSGGYVGGKYVTGAQATMMANAYALRSQQIEEELASKKQKKQEETDTKKEQDASAANEARNRREAQRKLAEDRTKWAKEQAELEKQLQKDITQAKIDAMAEGEEKILAQSKHDHQKELDAIEKELKDLEEKQKERMKSLWNEDPDHKKKSAKNKTKNSEAQAGQDAVVFNEEDWKNGTGAYAEGGKYRKEWEKNQEILILARQKATDKSIALGAKEVETLTKEYETERDKRVRDEEKTLATISQMREEYAKKFQMLSDNSLTAEQRNGIHQQLKALSDGVEQANRKINNIRHQKLQSLYDYLKEYGSIEEKKLAITKEYENKISQETDPAKIASLQKKMEEELKNVNFEALKADINWEVVFNDISKLSTHYLGELKNKLKVALDAKDITAENAKVLAEKIREIENTMRERGNFAETLLPALRERLRLVQETKDAEKELQDFRSKEKNAETNVDKAKSNLLGQMANYGVDTGLGLKASSKEFKDEIEGNADISSKFKDELLNLVKAIEIAEVDLGKAKENTSTAETKKNYFADMLKGKGGEGKFKLKDLFGDTSSPMNVMNIVGKNSQSLVELTNTLGLHDTKFGKAVEGFNEGTQSFLGAIQSLASGDVFGAINGVISGFVSWGTTIGNMFGLGADDNGYADMMAKYERVSKIWDELLEKKKAYISESYAEESKKARDEALKIIKDDEEAQRRLVKTYAGGGASAGSHSYGYRFNRDWGNNAEVQAAARKAGLSNTRDVTFQVINSATAEQLATFKEALGATWAEMDSDFTSHWDKIIEVIDKSKEVWDRWREQMTGISYDGFRDEFTSALMDMDKSADDFTKSFTEKLTKSVIDGQIDKLYGKELEKLYQDWADAMSDGDLSDMEVESLKRRQEELALQMIDTRDMIAEKTGYDDVSSSEARGTINSANSMSEDTANELIGRVTAVQLGVERIAAQDISIAAAENALLANLDAKMNAYIEATRETQAQGVGMLESIQDILATSYIELRGINENTSAIVEPIRIMSSEISTMRNKIDTL